ncbi:MAG: ABC transporter substrate-binding protein [Rubrivivax sp.]
MRALFRPPDATQPAAGASRRRWLAGVGSCALLGLPAWPLRAAPRELSLWTMQLSPHHDSYVRGLLQGFEAQHPGVRVRWVDVPWAEMERKALTAIAAGTPPDVVNLNPQFSAKLAELGALREPPGFLSPAQVGSYLPSAWAANRLAGRTFALPWYVTSNITLCNRALLERAGVPPPRDWPELLQAAPLLRARTGQYAYFTALDGSAALEMLAATRAPQLPLLTPDHCGSAFDNAEGRAFFEAFSTLYQRQWVPRNVLTDGHRMAVSMFMSGQVAMVSTGMQFLAQVRNAAPALYGQVAVAPQLGAGQPNLAVMNLAVPMASRTPELAFALAAYITESRHQLELARRVPVLPSSAASYDDPLFTCSSGDPVLDAARALTVRQVREGTVLVPPVRRYSRLRASFVRALQSAMLGRQHPDEAVRTVAREWRGLLGCAA